MWESYQSAKLAEGLSPYTLQKYYISLRIFQQWLNETGNIPSRESIQRFLGSRKNQGLSQSRVRNDWVALRSFYSWNERVGNINLNPISQVKAPKLSKKSVSIYTTDQVRKILSCTQTLQERLAYVLCWRTGLRSFELKSLRRDHIGSNPRVMLIHGKGEKDRFVPFDDECDGLLHLYLSKNNDDPIFSISLGQLRRSLRDYCRLSGVKQRPRPIHCFRHTFACDYLRDGGNPLDLKYILGHSSLSMVDYYTQWIAAERAIKAYHELRR